MTHDDPLAYIHQTAAHQLRHAADEIENGDGLVTDFDYDEEVQEDFIGPPMNIKIQEERIVTVELTYLLPE